MMASATPLALPLAATHRVVDGIHRHATNVGTSSKPSASSSFSARHIHVIDVAYLANRRVRVFMNSPDLSGRKSHQRVASLPVVQDGLLAGATSHLSSAAGNNFDIMNDRSQWDGLQRERIADFRRNIFTRNNLSSNFKPVRRQNITLDSV